MNKIRIILSYILGFTISVLLLILTIMFILKRTILDKNFIFRLFDENNYYENVYKNINEDIKDYMTSSGLEDSILDNVVLKENVEKDIDAYIDYAYLGKKYIVDTTYVETTLKTNIDAYLKGMNLGVDNTNELDLFVKDIADIYQKQVSFYHTFDGFVTRVSSLTNIVSKYTIVVGVIVGLLIIVLALFRFLNVGSVVLSSGIMLFLLKLFIYERVDYENILLISDNFSVIIKSVFKYISSYMISISLIIVIIGFILCLFNFGKINLENNKSN